MKKNYTLKLDIRRATISKIPGIVSGDTANVFTIFLFDDGKPLALDATLNKVVAIFHRSDGKVYAQDAESGLRIANGAIGEVVIDVRSASFTTGKNTIELQIYSREDQTSTEYPDLITSAYAEFTARQATLASEAENAPSQLPMLEQLIADANDAVESVNALLASMKNAVLPYLLHLNGLTWNSDKEIVNMRILESADDLRAVVGKRPLEIDMYIGDFPSGSNFELYRLRQSGWYRHGDYFGVFLVCDTWETYIEVMLEVNPDNEIMFDGSWVDKTAIPTPTVSDGLYVLNVLDPHWNGNSFEGYADKSADDVEAAIDTGRTFVVRVSDADNETVYTMLEAYASPDAYDVSCKSEQARCIVRVGGGGELGVQISGELL